MRAAAAPRCSGQPAGGTRSRHKGACRAALRIGQPQRPEIPPLTPRCLRGRPLLRRQRDRRLRRCRRRHPWQRPPWPQRLQPRPRRQDWKRRWWQTWPRRRHPPLHTRPRRLLRAEMGQPLSQRRQELMMMAAVAVCGGGCASHVAQEHGIFGRRYLISAMARNGAPVFFVFHRAAVVVLLHANCQGAICTHETFTLSSTHAHVGVPLAVAANSIVNGKGPLCGVGGQQSIPSSRCIATAIEAGGVRCMERTGVAACHAATSTYILQRNNHPMQKHWNSTPSQRNIEIDNIEVINPTASWSLCARSSVDI
eukprot:jgi/Ulvmu1/9844/UM056_0086.1